ncbi:MAG: TetR/AcrR family transcriptional regulator [Myxococcota bacterium]
MPRARFHRLAPPAREKLLVTATRHFAERGFEQASLNEILSEVGISKGVYYYYFDDKDDLFATVLEDGVDRLLEAMPLPELNKLSARTFWPEMERFTAGWAKRLDPGAELFKVALQVTEAQRRSARFSVVLEKSQRLYRALIEPGQRLGCVRTDLPVSDLIRLLEANDAVLDNIFVASGAEPTRRAIDRHVALVFDTFRRLLVAAPSGKSRRKRRPGG